MIYQPLIYAGMAGFFCAGLGILSLYHNPHSKEVRLFAFYNFSLALWNLSDFVIFYPHQSWGLLHIRLCGIGGSFLIPFVLHFIYEVVNIIPKKAFLRITQIYYGLGFFFAILHFTPGIYQSANYVPFQKETYIEDTGFLYPFFEAYLLTGLLALVIPLKKVYSESKGQKRNQIGYILLAFFLGFTALIAYFVSLKGKDYPWIYFPLEVLVSLTFAYAIFKHDLISTKTTIRRALLFLGISIVLLTLIYPIAYLFYSQISNLGSFPLSSFIFFLILIAGLVSLGPLIFSFLIRRSNLFQDKTHSFLTHELKSPLASIQSAQAILDEELAKPEPDPKTVKDYMGIIQRNTTRLESFTAHILDYNRIKEKANPSELKPVPLAQLIQECVKDNTNVRNRCHIKIEGSPTLTGNPDGLKQIVTNLLSNAEKYAPNGTIQINLKEGKEKCEVSIQDQGVGLDQKEKAKIFEPFVRFEKKKATIKGSGLGLAIVKKWIDYHNGQIWAESDGPGQGTTISFTLPK